MCPKKRQAFANISPTRNTVAERVSELAGDVDRQLMDKVKSFIAFSVADTDNSRDITNIAHLAIFIHGVDENNLSMLLFIGYYAVCFFCSGPPEVKLGCM